MPTTYTHRVIIVIPVVNLAAANQVAAGMDPAGGGGSTFGACQLSAIGTAPATHYACNTLMEPSKHDALPTYSAILLPGGKAWSVVTGDELLPGDTSWVPGGYAGWTAAQCFAELGLSVIVGQP